MPAESKLPYVPGYGNISKALTAIQRASTPDRFTQDFLSTKLGLPGGSPKPVIPFLKRTGFLGSDGTPTELYTRFRNPAFAGAAAAEALRIGYAPLYEMNEYAHELSDKDLKGLVVQATGSEPNAVVVKSTVGSFKALKEFADFDAATQPAAAAEGVSGDGELPPSSPQGQLLGGISLGYTINLHLPATSDVAVFNAIFKSLREHLLK